MKAALKKYTGGDKIYAIKTRSDENQEDQRGRGKGKVSFIKDFFLFDTHFPSLNNNIVVQKKDRKFDSYKLDNVTLNFMNGNTHDVSFLEKNSNNWSVTDLNARIRKREEDIEIAEKKRLEDIEITEKKRMKEVEDLSRLVKKEYDEEQKNIRNKMEMDIIVNKQDKDLLRLQEVISKLQREINMKRKSPQPFIVKNDPNINYEPKFIETIQDTYWVYNSCGCGSFTMHVPTNYLPADQIEIDAAYKKFLTGGSPTFLVYTDAYDPYSGITIKNANTLNFSNMTTSSLGGTVQSIANQPGRVIQTPNPKYNGRRPIHETFQMRTYDDQFEQSFKKISLDPSSDEYKTVENNFLTDTCGTFQTTKSAGVRVLGVIKVVNPVRAKFYELMKDVSTDKTEVMVYHGTRGTNIETVAKEGLDSRVGAGGYYGRAIYGSDSAFYSYNGYGYALPGTYSEGMLFYTKFLVGKVKELSYHDSSLQKNPVGFDSVISTNPGDEGIRTVYDNARSYIEYIVHYTSRP